MSRNVIIGILLVALVAGLIYAVTATDLLGILLRMHGGSPAMH